MSFNGIVTKVLAGTVFAGGITLAGITWQGDGDTTNIKGNIDSLKVKLTNAVDDNKFLMNSFNNLNGMYNTAVGKANETIDQFNHAKAQLEAQIAKITTQLNDKQAELDQLIADKAADEAEKEKAQLELQGQIDDLEIQLEAANKKIKELAQYADEVDSSIEYTPVDRIAYTAVEQYLNDADLPELFGAAGALTKDHFSLSEMLTYAMQDEYLAQAEYIKIMDKFGTQKPFSNIKMSEGKHIDMLTPLFEKYGVTLPANTANDHVVIPDTLLEAYKTGVIAEINNIAMYDAFLKQDIPDDLRAVFLNLKMASQNHLNAFENHVAKAEGTSGGNGGNGGGMGGKGKGGPGGQGSCNN